MKVGADPVAYQVTDDSVAKLLGIIAYSSGNIMKMVSCFCIFDSLKETLSGHINELPGFRRNLSYSVGSGCI